jgi:hypothetical protein
VIKNVSLPTDTNLPNYRRSIISYAGDLTPSKRSDRYGTGIERGSKRHKVCFADEKPNGKTSGVILVKTYNVESFKEFNRLEGAKASKEIKNGKEVYNTTTVVETDDSGVFACSCILF